MIRYTPKQRDLMRLWQHGDLRRINLLEGSVSSGKTWISLILWAFWVKTMPMDGLYMMCAKSLTTLKRNCLLLLQEQVGKSNFTFSLSAKEGYLFDRHVIFEGANDMRSESKIRGLTLQGAYCDELTQFPEDFFTMLLSRLRLPGAKLIATTNPDRPTHWLKAEYIDRADELDFLDVGFSIDDNTELDPEYVRNIKKEYTGVFYKRFILGQWVVAEGLVYPMYDNTVEVKKRAYTEYVVSMDYGIMNPTAMILWGHGDDGVWYAVREYYHSGRETNEQKTDQQYYDDMCEVLGDIMPRYIIVDPSATSFITLVKQRKKYHIRPADNTVLEGIQHTATALVQGQIMFNKCCKHTIEEFGLYSWDDNSAEDAVIKENDHCLTGDTVVNTIFGGRKIKDLVGKFGLVWSYNEKRKKRCIRPFWGARKTRENQPILKITLENGKVVRCTPDHKILTENGWIKAKYLTESSRIIDIMD